jgi:predicted membrane-bound spermidine synthase
MTGWSGRLRRPWRALLFLEVANMLGAAGLAGALFLLFRRPTPASFLEHALLLAMNAAAGMLVGLEFPLANRILQDAGKEGAGVAGALYAWDLAGATVGAVAVSAILLPALGLVPTALLVALVKGGSLLLVGITARQGRICHH